MNRISGLRIANAVVATSPTIDTNRHRAVSTPATSSPAALTPGASAPAALTPAKIWGCGARSISAESISEGRPLLGLGGGRVSRWWAHIDLGEERGSGVVEWLGIAALSVAMLVGIFAGMEQVANGVIDMIRASLGVG